MMASKLLGYKDVISMEDVVKKPVYHKAFKVMTPFVAKGVYFPKGLHLSAPFADNNADIAILNSKVWDHKEKKLQWAQVDKEYPLVENWKTQKAGLLTIGFEPPYLEYFGLSHPIPVGTLISKKLYDKITTATGDSFLKENIAIVKVPYICELYNSFMPVDPKYLGWEPYTPENISHKLPEYESWEHIIEPDYVVIKTFMLNTKDKHGVLISQHKYEKGKSMTQKEAFELGLPDKHFEKHLKMIL